MKWKIGNYPQESIAFCTENEFEMVLFLNRNIRKMKHINIHLNSIDVTKIDNNRFIY